jgi:hypothetical protein
MTCYAAGGAHEIFTISAPDLIRMYKAAFKSMGVSDAGTTDVKGRVIEIRWRLSVAKMQN